MRPVISERASACAAAVLPNLGIKKRITAAKPIIQPINGSSSQPQLCWNFWLPKLKRTYCQAWQVPAGWIAGSVLQNGGNFVNDNREPQGGSGNLYWQQLSAAQ